MRAACICGLRGRKGGTEGGSERALWLPGARCRNRIDVEAARREQAGRSELDWGGCACSASSRWTCTQAGLAPPPKETVISRPLSVCYCFFERGMTEITIRRQMTAQELVVVGRRML